MKNIYTLFTLFLLTYSNAVNAQFDMLDSTFDSDGMVVTAVCPDVDLINSIAIQADGKIVAAGRAKIAGVTQFALVRYNSDGSLDNTFGTAGIVSTAIGTTFSSAAAIAIQSNGKILAGGGAFTTTFDFAVVRYNTDGTLDVNFDGDGIAFAPIGSGNDAAKAIVIQSDGKIVLVGGSDNNFALARFNTNGSLDISFDTDGVLTTDFGGIPSDAYSVAMQADNKIVVAGVATAANATVENFAVARYNTDGSLDVSFDTDGKLTTDLGPGEGDIGEAVAIQPDGKILVAGETQPTGNNENFALVRYNTNGSLDNTFGTGGITTTDFFGDIDNPSTLVLQPDGRIIVAGHSYNPGSFPDFSLARYLTDGTLDNTFGTGGKLWTEFGSGVNTSASVALQADGKIVLGGSINTGTATSEFALARYIPNNITTGVINLSSSPSSIFFHPNPFSSSAILWSDNPLKNATLYVSNYLGQTVKKVENVSGQSVTLFRDNLQNGLYFLHLTQDNKTIVTLKLIIAD